MRISVESMEWLFSPLFPGRFGICFLWREENWSTRRKTLRAETRTNNKLNPRDRESNPGHTGGRHALSPLRHPCSPKDSVLYFSNKIILAILLRLLTSDNLLLVGFCHYLHLHPLPCHLHQSALNIIVFFGNFSLHNERKCDGVFSFFYVICFPFLLSEHIDCTFERLCK